MMDLLQRRPLIVALAGAGVLLLLVIGLETGFGTRITHPTPPPPAKPAAAPEAKLIPPMAAVSAEQAYPETTARPLFVPTRRPAPVEAAAGKAAFEKGQYVLHGVIVVGDQRTALLKEKTSGRIHRVDKGQEVNGITLESVEPTRVVLASGGERETLNLTVQKAGAGAATAAAPGAATAGAAHEGGPFAAAAAVAPGAPNVAPPQNPGAMPSPAANAPAANPGGTTATPNRAPSPVANQPMTPEELLARRRARRNQPTQ